MNRSISLSLLRRTLSCCALILLLALLGGCSSAVVRAPVSLPVLPPLITTSAEHYTIESRESEVRFLVYRSGPLAAFGHNHVIRAATIQGDVYLNDVFSLSGFSFELPVGDFRVDEPTERAAEGADFASQPSAAAISGTLHNMLGPSLLDAAHYPRITVRSVRIAGPQAHPVMTARITLRGVQRDVSIPIRLTVADSKLTASGRFEIKQSDFGITPFSILGGGLQVADTVKIQFHIVATTSR